MIGEELQRSDTKIFKIKASLSNLSKSERSVAEILLAYPEQSVTLSIARLATGAGVSEPTVNRFFRSLGHRGFPYFKLGLARKFVNPAIFVACGLQHSDFNLQLAHKMFETTLASVSGTRSLICA